MVISLMRVSMMFGLVGMLLVDVQEMNRRVDHYDGEMDASKVGKN